MWIASQEEVVVRIDHQDRWLCDGVPIQPRIAAFFARHVQPLSPTSYGICLGPQQWPLLVHDTPYWLTQMGCERDDNKRLLRIEMVVSDGQRQTLDASTLFRLPNDRIYCRIVRQGFCVPCRLQTKHIYDLADDWQLQGEQWALVFQTQLYPLPTYASLPLGFATA